MDHGGILPSELGVEAPHVVVERIELLVVDISDMLGGKDDGWRPLKEAVMKATSVLCAYKVGGCNAIFDRIPDYSRFWIQFGRPSGRFQRVQDLIIEMINQSDSARWTTYEALWKPDTQPDSEENIHLAKAVVSEAYFQVCTLGHQVFSGLSYSKEHVLSFIREPRAISTTIWEIRPTIVNNS
ncbi:MAG: acyl-CoA/acyl-ACP dehydrogenase [Proteobacteria bacterium]|nr:acyl-CoA/acyl-ACP dehydrogenase [Pseudomonadota bacterium]